METIRVKFQNHKGIIYNVQINLRFHSPPNTISSYINGIRYK